MENMTGNNRNNKPLRKAFWAAAALILLFLGVQNIGTVAKAAVWLLRLISPLIIGVLIAMILNVPMRAIESRLWRKAKSAAMKRLRRPVAFILSLIFIFGVAAGIIRLVIPELAAAVNMVAQSAIEIINRFSAMSRDEFAALPFGDLLLNIDWNLMVGRLQDWLRTKSGSIVNAAFGTLGSAFGTLGSVIGGVYDAFIAIIFSVYVIFSKDTLKRQTGRLIRAWLPGSNGEWLIHALSTLSANFRNFVAGQSTEAVILGVLCMVGMLLLRIPYAPMVGTLVGVTALIPVVGAFIGAGIGAFVILTAEPFKALVFIIFLVILQQFEGNIIYPRMMGSKVNLPGMWVLAAVTVGGALAGAAGMLLAVPLASTGYVLLKEATAKRERLNAAGADRSGEEKNE